MAEKEKTLEDRLKEREAEKEKTLEDRPRERIDEEFRHSNKPRTETIRDTLPPPPPKDDGDDSN